MQLALRRGFGYAFDPFRGMAGLGDGEYIDPETGLPVTFTAVPSSDPGIDMSSGSLYSQLIAQGVNPVDAEAYLATGQLPGGSTGPVTPGVALTPVELAAEQARATSWLSTIPGALSAASKIAALTTAQIAAGVQSGALKPSSTCPSGYMLAGSAQCTGATSTGILPGVSNTTLGIVAVLFFGLMMMGGKRR